jgi:DNA-binding response OmpR family regulator
MAKILIVDDDTDIVEAGRLILENADHEVQGANSREDGMKAIESFRPDLLILDVMMEMPDDGIAMAQELRVKGFTAPILMLTSVSQVSGFRIGKSDTVNPVDDLQEKPISPAALVAKVDALLKKKKEA